MTIALVVKTLVVKTLDVMRAPAGTFLRTPSTRTTALTRSCDLVEDVEDGPGVFGLCEDARRHAARLRRELDRELDHVERLELRS